MTPSQRLEAAKTEVGRRKVVALAATPGPWVLGTNHWGGGHETHTNVAAIGAVKKNLLDLSTGYVRSNHEADGTHIAANDPAHVLQVLEIHRLILALVDPWLLNRLDRPSPMTQLVCAVLDLYAPETADV